MACTQHAWLGNPANIEGQCEECDFAAKTAATLADPARTYTADDIRAAFIAGANWTGGDVEKGASAYVAALEG